MRLELLLLLERHERDGVAGHARAARPADAVDVVLGVVRQLEVDDLGQPLDVQAAGRDVGGHQHPDLARLELLERLLAVGLAAVAVDGGRIDALPVEP